MTRLERCKLSIERGIKYNPETGEIFGVSGKLITNTCEKGYIRFKLRFDNKNYELKGHHFAWYWVYGNVDFTDLDHSDTNPSNNKIDNLRIITKSQQSENRKSKGYWWEKRVGKWRTMIVINNNGKSKRIHLGYFDLEEDARNTYLQAKEKYHII